MNYAWASEGDERRAGDRGAGGALCVADTPQRDASRPITVNRPTPDRTYCQASQSQPGVLGLLTGIL